MSGRQEVWLLSCTGSVTITVLIPLRGSLASNNSWGGGGTEGNGDGGGVGGGGVVGSGGGGGSGVVVVLLNFITIFFMYKFMINHPPPFSPLDPTLFKKNH